MRVGIDVRMIKDFPTGVGSYLEGLVSGLSTVNTENEYLLIGNKNSLKVNSKFKFFEISSLANSFKQHLTLSRELKQINMDLFLTNVWGASVNLPPSYALVIFDCYYNRYPEEISLKARLYNQFLDRRIAKKAKLIFTISDFVKKDVMNYYGISEEKITTIYGSPGEKYSCIDDLNSREENLARYKIKKPFVVAIGNYRPHKNFERMLQAFSRLKKDPVQRYVDDLNLVIVGGADARGKEVGVRSIEELVNKLGLNDSVVLTGVISDDKTVASIINDALALIHPSYHEGLGLTVLESMRCGTPVIAAGNTSIPEVGGEVVIYIDPFDVESIYRALLRVASWDGVERYDWSQKCLSQAKNFSWQKTAEKLDGEISKL